MNKRRDEARLICADFKLSPELEVDRKLIGWFKRNHGKEITMEDTLLCKILDITKDQYWLSVARLHYMGVTRFPVEMIQK